MADKLAPSGRINKDVITTLNSLLELEMAGVVRYTHYSFMIFGFNRIPICKWMREQADESLRHAHLIGELVTHYDHHPTLKIGKLLETHQHNIRNILEESLSHEKQAVAVYHKLLSQVQGRWILVEEFASEMIAAEEMHLGEIRKMLKTPGEI